MNAQGRVSKSAVLILALVLSFSSPAAATQQKSKKNEKLSQGTPVLWQEPTDITERNLLLGPGGAAMQPDLSRVTFIEEEKGGYSKKYRVRDAAGMVWVAKLGKEAQSETAATRLVWAAGYLTDISYLVPRLKIEGKGTFENVRLEARPEDVLRLGEWKWDRNPFSGTRELQGLKVLMALLENWDLKDANNRILMVRGAGGNQLRYIISDLGATFGKTGGQGSPIAMLRSIKGSRNEPADFAEDKFIEKVEGGLVSLHYSGKNSGMMRGIKVEDARWLGTLLSRLSDRQIQDAFRAANYKPEEVRLLSEAVRSRIMKLVQLP